MFGISLMEIALIGAIALVVVGPQKLPGMLRSVGLWVRKLRRLTTEVRAQTGIDQILREEGIDGIHELRGLLRGEVAAKRRQPSPADDPYEDKIGFDDSREYPVEGVDSYDALPDDLLDSDDEEPAAGQAEEAAATPASAPKAASASTEAASALTEVSAPSEAAAAPSETESKPPETAAGGARTGVAAPQATAPSAPPRLKPARSRPPPPPVRASLSRPPPSPPPPPPRGTPSKPAPARPPTPSSAPKSSRLAVSEPPRPPRPVSGKPEVKSP